MELESPIILISLEIWSHIFEFLEWRTLFRTACVCHVFCDLIKEVRLLDSLAELNLMLQMKSIWRSLICTCFSPVADYLLVGGVEGYKASFMRLVSLTIAGGWKVKVFSRSLEVCLHFAFV